MITCRLQRKRESQLGPFEQLRSGRTIIEHYDVVLSEGASLRRQGEVRTIGGHFCRHSRHRQLGLSQGVELPRSINFGSKLFISHVNLVESSIGRRWRIKGRKLAESERNRHYSRN